MIRKSESYVKSMLKLVDTDPGLKMLLEIYPGVAKMVSDYKPMHQRKLAILVSDRLKGMLQTLCTEIICMWLRNQDAETAKILESSIQQMMTAGCIR